MQKKKYISATGIQYTFPVMAKGKAVFISFKGNENEYSTANKDIQAAIEATAKFKNKEIVLYNSTTPEQNDEQSGETMEIKEYPEVTTFQEARDILNAAPYKVRITSLNTPDKIKNKATQLGALFPNINWE